MNTSVWSRDTGDTSEVGWRRLSEKHTQKGRGSNISSENDRFNICWLITDDVYSAYPVQAADDVVSVTVSDYNGHELEPVGVSISPPPPIMYNVNEIMPLYQIINTEIKLEPDSTEVELASTFRVIVLDTDSWNGAVSQ